MVFTPARASAQGDAALAKAKAAFMRGRTLYTQKNYVAAAAAFNEAYGHKPIAAFIFNIAVAFEKAKQYAKAVNHFERYLQKKPRASDAASIRKRIAALQKALAATKPPVKPPTGTKPPPPRAVVVPVLPKIQPKGVVVINTSPTGATLYLNRKSNRLGITPWEGALPTGRHVLLIAAEGYKLKRKTISVSPDRMLDVQVDLAREHYLGFVTITANRPGAKVFIDNLGVGAVGKTPHTGFLKPGRHTIWVSAPGYARMKNVVNIVSGRTHKVHFPLVRLRIGWLSVVGASASGADVLVNGKKRCTVPCDRVKLPPGEHDVVVRKKGMKPASTKVDIVRIEQTMARVRLQKKPSRVSAWVSYAFAAAFLAGGITMGYLSRQISDEIESDITNGVLVNSRDSRFQKGRIYAYVANGLFGVAGLAAIFGLYYSFASRGPKSAIHTARKRITFTPQLGPNYAGFHGQLRF